MASKQKELALEESKMFAGSKVLGDKLRKLAETVENMPLDKCTHTMVYKLIGRITATIRASVADRRKKLEEELAALKSLGV